VRRKLIGCEVLCRELCHGLVHSPFVVDTEFLPKALHDEGGRAMCEKLQALIDAVDPAIYETVLLGYALCGNGTAGLHARDIPLVIPRAHDCIALLMGSLAKYNQYFEAHPGAYYRSIGWLERGEDLRPFTPGAAHTLQALIDKYGEDNGRYVFNELMSYQTQYTQLTYIRTGLEPDDRYEQQAQAEAQRRGWSYERVEGNTGIFERLLSGEWNESEFLVVPPGRRVETRWDGSIFAAV
jgi:hypothetical protein